jgi:hypothetical protein
VGVALRDGHPVYPKPAIMGNCPGGWAAMMLAAAHPNDSLTRSF